MKRKISKERDIPGRRELEKESPLLNNIKNNDLEYAEIDHIDEGYYDEVYNEEEYNTQNNRVRYPDIEGELGMSKFEADIAQQVGYFSDQVILGSPASEAGESGNEALKDIIEKANKKLVKKSKEKRGKE